MKHRITIIQLHVYSVLDPAAPGFSFLSFSSFFSFCFKDELLATHLRCVVSPKHCQLSAFWRRFGQAAFSVMNILFEITTLNYTTCHNVKAVKEKRMKPLGRDVYFSLKFSSILAIFHQSDKKLFVRASWNEDSNIQSQKD